MPFVPKAEPRSRGRAMRKSEANNRLEVKMDANRLIAEVQKRPALWNQRHMSYHNREVTNRVWMEIAGIFKLPSKGHAPMCCGFVYLLAARWWGCLVVFLASLSLLVFWSRGWGNASVCVLTCGRGLERPPGDDAG